MKKYTILIPYLFLILVSCKKDDNRTLLDTTFFELDDCFSVNSLADQSLIITNNDDYLYFEDEIRRHFYPSCDSVYLPDIDFTKNFFTGIYTSSAGCQVTYTRKVYYNSTQNRYDYEITRETTGDCEILVTSFNCAIIPIQSDSTRVNFIIH